MAKTKFEIELTGLKIKYEGEREDMPAVSNAVANQFGQLLATPTVVSGQSDGKLPAPADPSDTQILESKPKSIRKSRTKSAAALTNGSKRGRKKEPAVDWKHNADRWGNPNQSWNPTKKSIWLLYVVGHESDVNAMSASRISTTFNKHFKDSGPIQAGNVSRDLKRCKKATPPLVQNDTTQDGDPWYLLEAGKSHAEKLVLEARGIQPKET